MLESSTENTCIETSIEMRTIETEPPPWYEPFILRNETRTIHEWTPGHTDWAELLSMEGITYSGDFYSECTYNLSYMLPPENELLLFPQNLAEAIPCLYAMGIWHIPQGSYPADISELPHIEEMLYQKRTYAGGEKTIIYEYALLRPYAEDLLLFIRVRSKTEIQEWSTILEFLRSIELKERVEYCLLKTDSVTVFREEENRIRMECADGRIFRYTPSAEEDRILGVSSRTGDELTIGIQRKQHYYDAVFLLSDGTVETYEISAGTLSDAIGITPDEILFFGWASYASGLIDAYVTTDETQYTLRCLTNTWKISNNRFVYDDREITPAEIFAFWQCVTGRMWLVTQLTTEMPALYDGLSLYSQSSRDGISSAEALFYRVDQIFTEECAARYRTFTDYYGRSCFREAEDGTLLVTNKYIANNSYWILPSLTLKDGNIEPLSTSEWRAKLMGSPDNDDVSVRVRKISADEWHITLPRGFGTARLVWQNDSWKWDISHQLDLQDRIVKE